MAGSGGMGQPPIDRGWAWMISFGFFMYVFFMVGIAKSFGLILEALIKEFGVSTATATIPISISLLVYAFGAPTAILIAEKFTIQRVVIIGAIIGFAGIAASSLLFNMAFFVLTFGIFYGVGNSCFYGNGMIMIGRYFRIRRSVANGLALSGASFGQFALPPFIEYLLENYKLSGTLLLMSAIYLHGAITGCLFRPIERYDSYVIEIKAPTTEEQEPMIEKLAINGDGKLEKTVVIMEEQNNEDRNGLLTKEDTESGDSRRVNKQIEEDDDDDMWPGAYKAVMGSQGSMFMMSSSMPDIHHKGQLAKSTHSNQEDNRHFFSRIIDFRLLRNYVTIFFTVVSFLCFFGYFNFVLFLPAVLQEKGFEKYDRAFLMSICGIGDLIARISVGFFADLNLISRYKIKAVACLLCALDIFMFVFANTYPWLGVHCFLYGFLGGAYVCMLAVVLVDFVGLADMGRVLAVALFFQGIGASAGNPFLGFLKDVTGSFAVVTITCAVTLGMGAVVLFFYPVVCRLEAKRVQRLNVD